MEKKKTNLLTKVNITEKELLDELINKKDFNKYLEGKKISKSFFVKNRLINILTE